MDGLVGSPCSPRTLKSLLQHHSSKASILLCSAFFIVQLSHPYITTQKTIALTRRIFVDKVMSLLFNMLSRLVIAFLPRSKRLLFYGCNHHLQWFWRPRKIKSATVSTISPCICHEFMGPDAMKLVFWMLSFKPTFSLSSFTFFKRLFSSSSLSAIRYCVRHWNYKDDGRSREWSPYIIMDAEIICLAKTRLYEYQTWSILLSQPKNWIIIP